MYLDPARPGVEDLIDSIVAGRAQLLHLRRGRAPSRSSHEQAVVGVQSAAGYAEGRPLHTCW